MADNTLYSTVAQVLPLFLLALALERSKFGVHEESTDPTLDACIAIGILGAAALGEFACFVALAGTPTRSTKLSAEVSLGIAGVALLIELITTQVTAYRKRVNEETTVRRHQWIVSVFAGVVIVSAGAVFLLLGIGAYTSN